MKDLKTEKSPIVKKTEELCQTILNQPAFDEIKEKINTFTSDEAAQNQYRNILDMQNQLQQKQGQGQLTQEEIDQFEKMREELLNNTVAKGFIDAQQEIHQVQETVNQYVAKTFELGRMPQDADFEEGSCGPNCGCH